MGLKVFYQVFDETVSDAEIKASSSAPSVIYNFFEIPEVNTEKEIFLLDILLFIANNERLAKNLGLNYSYYVDYQGKFVRLHSPSSVVPIKSDGIAFLRLYPSISPPLMPRNQLQYCQMESKKRLMGVPMTRAKSSSTSSASYDRPPPYSEGRSAQQQSSSSRPESYSSNRDNYTSSTSSSQQEHYNGPPESHQQEKPGQSAAAGLSVNDLAGAAEVLSKH
jgi:hypothetical protein